MKKTIIRLFCIVLLFCVLVEPIYVFSAEINSDKKCSLTLTYSKNNIAFSDLEISIYRVADCNFCKIGPFDKYSVNITNIKSQTEWNDIASTFSGFVQSEKIKPYKKARTDTNGKVVFKGIDVGLYLIYGVVAEQGNKTYTFFDSMVYLPTKSSDKFIYDVSVKPKSKEITKNEKSYSILKLWKDDNDSNRPKSVTVDILKNGDVVETIVLDSSNNWKYTFKITDVKSKWSVMEKNIPSDYTVTVTEKDTSFVIINTKKEQNKPSANVPQTGDTAPIELYILLFCISGLLLIVLGFGLRRKENASEK